MSGYDSERSTVSRWDDDSSEFGGTGLLATTLRRVGVLVVIVLVLAAVARTGSDDTATPEESMTGALRDRPAYSRQETAALGQNELAIRAGRDGHYRLRAEANGRDMEFLVDTGATTVVLDVAQAETLGIDERSLAFDGVLLTANGEIPGAAASLNDLRFGTLRLDDVAATVVRAELPIPLLGMSVLGRLGSYEVADGQLVLRW